MVSSSASTVALRALSNGNLLCAPNNSAPLTPSCSSPNDVGAKFVKLNIAGSGSTGEFTFQSVSFNRYLSIDDSGNLVSNALDVANGARFWQVHPGGIAS